ncbi:shikimate dehydrogenase [Legionella waltersii]|uniref:Shikimate dehydrogenase (NADP(+)) n=1 Tax=Legionella waltersii TaxID=66969 RepID=A0A0W1A4P1_9GAMM|nr:shikimate dehydrogenase [Legionella waltersii]KTD76299.1 shikimate 5-dehydrogenase [Legionella waltersii]SNV13536.1 shikimate 5-dehydrogenase [Legionella waltersii]
MQSHFAVIGNPIAHSLSPIIHQLFAEQTGIQLVYEKIPGEDAIFEQQVTDFFAQGGKGLNVTLPYKQRAFALAEYQTPRCALAKAANTLWHSENKLCADNTDGIGLLRDLERYLDLKNINVLILGAGGAARGIVPALLSLNTLQLTIANRTLEKALMIQKEFPEINCLSVDHLTDSFDLIINATSASLQGGNLGIPEILLKSKPFAYDLAYNKQQPTPFVAFCLGLGCSAVDGLGMLVEQAAEAFYIWNGSMPSTKEVLEQLRR